MSILLNEYAFIVYERGDHMTDYKKMYMALVDEIDQTIERLKTALSRAEDIYIETCDDGTTQE